MLAYLHRVAARVRAWCRRSPAEQIAASTVVAAPVLAPPRWQPRQRSNQPLLWTAKCSDTLKWWCGPVAVAAAILGRDRRLPVTGLGNNGITAEATAPEGATDQEARLI
jgi:hypothetical protein